MAGVATWVERSLNKCWVYYDGTGATSDAVVYPWYVEQLTSTLHYRLPGGSSARGSSRELFTYDEEG